MPCKCNKAFYITIYADFNAEEGRLARDFFFDKAIAYDVVDILTNEQGRQEMLRLSGQDTRPVIVVNDKAFVGFDAEALDAVLL
jgi:arsenate reductase-like glutaredoxin family protein